MRAQIVYKIKEDEALLSVRVMRVKRRSRDSFYTCFFFLHIQWIWYAYKRLKIWFVCRSKTHTAHALKNLVSYRRISLISGILHFNMWKLLIILIWFISKKILPTLNLVVFFPRKSHSETILNLQAFQSSVQIYEAIFMFNLEIQDRIRILNYQTKLFFMVREIMGNNKAS